MADFKFFPLLVDGVEVAEINGHTVDLKANGERMQGAGVTLGMSDGILTFDVKATAVQPIGGHSIDMVDLLRTRKEVGVGFQHNGGYYVMPCKVTEASIKSEAKNGSVTGDFTFMNSGEAQKVA
jgi:hypothetical protein